MPNPAAIVEIGVEVTDIQLRLIECFLSMYDIHFYIQPNRNPPWTSLADLEAACEGK